MLTSWRLRLEAANLSRRTIRTYPDDGGLFAAFLSDKGMPAAVGNIGPEQVEAFIATELRRTAPASATTR